MRQTIKGDNMKKLINNQLSDIAKPYFNEEIEIATDRGFNVETIEGMKELFNNTETVHCLLKYAYNRENAEKALYEIQSLLDTL
jgi:hypothetical protein